MSGKRNTRSDSSSTCNRAVNMTHRSFPLSGGIKETDQSAAGNKGTGQVSYSSSLRRNKAFQKDNIPEDKESKKVSSLESRKRFTGFKRTAVVRPSSTNLEDGAVGSEVKKKRNTAAVVQLLRPGMTPRSSTTRSHRRPECASVAVTGASCSSKILHSNDEIGCGGVKMEESKIPSVGKMMTRVTSGFTTDSRTTTGMMGMMNRTRQEYEMSRRRDPERLEMCKDFKQDDSKTHAGMEKLENFDNLPKRAENFRDNVENDESGDFDSTGSTNPREVCNNEEDDGDDEYNNAHNNDTCAYIKNSEESVNSGQYRGDGIVGGCESGIVTGREKVYMGNFDTFLFPECTLFEESDHSLNCCCCYSICDVVNEHLNRKEGVPNKVSK